MSIIACEDTKKINKFKYQKIDKPSELFRKLKERKGVGYGMTLDGDIPPVIPRNAPSVIEQIQMAEEYQRYANSEDAKDTK